jgi:hypothetical protein
VGEACLEADAQVAQPVLLTSAFVPKHYPQEIINYANTRGADKIIYAGYFPMGLSLKRIFTDMPHLPFKDDVWPKASSSGQASVRSGDEEKRCRLH